MPGTTAFPGALDTTTTLPTASTLSGIELDGDGTANNIHSNVHGVTGGAVIALETKLGSGSTTPTATAVLVGSGTGTSAWDTTPTFGDVSIADGKGLVVGHTAGDTTMWAAYATPEFQVLGTAADSGIGAVRYSADAFGPMIGMGKSRHADLAGNTIVADDDVLGKLIWFGADGNAAATIGAEVFARVNGTPGNGDMPTELVFATTADGASAATERLLIDAAGDVGIGIATPDSNLHIHNATAGTIASASNTVLTVENSANANIQILTPAANTGSINFGSPTSNERGVFQYDHNTDKMHWNVAAATRMSLTASDLELQNDLQIGKAAANTTYGMEVMNVQGITTSATPITAGYGAGSGNPGTITIVSMLRTDAMFESQVYFLHWNYNGVATISNRGSGVAPEFSVVSGALNVLWSVYGTWDVSTMSFNVPSAG